MPSYRDRILAELLVREERIHPIMLIQPGIVAHIAQHLASIGMVPAGDGTWIPTKQTADWLENHLEREELIDQFGAGPATD